MGVWKRVQEAAVIIIFWVASPTLDQVPPAPAPAPAPAPVPAPAPGVRYAAGVEDDVGPIT